MDPTTIATCCNKMQFNAEIMLIKAIKEDCFSRCIVYICMFIALKVKT